MLTSDEKNQDKKVVVFPVKKRRGKGQSFAVRVAMLYAVLLGTAWLTMWFSQKSIGNYWQTKYHRASPFAMLEAWEVWRAGEQLQSSLNEAYAGFQAAFAEQDKRWQASRQRPAPAAKAADKPPVIKVEKLVAKTGGKVAAAPPPAKAASAPAAPQQQTAAPAPQQMSIILKAGDKVLVAGDSIIQGVAPYLGKSLKNDYHVETVNKSQQSTGLAYPKFFDWPATIEQEVKNDPNIKLLVILVGANDPWDFPDPSKSGGAPFLKFQTPEWEKVYLERVNRIIDTMAKNGGKVIWLGPPLMKKPKLNEQMVYLNGVLARELDGKKPNVLWVDTAAMLSDAANPGYQDSITDENGETVRVRSKDGIHFTAQGQQFVAARLMNEIGYLPADNDHHDAASQADGGN